MLLTIQVLNSTCMIDVYIQINTTWIKGPRLIYRDFLNDAKCKNIIGWLLKFRPISLAYSLIQVLDSLPVSRAVLLEIKKK